MSWKDSLNRALSRTTGYQVQKARSPQKRRTPKQPGRGEGGRADRGARPAAGRGARGRTAADTPRRQRRVVPDERLVPSPIFILSTVRSGSTLLRVILDSHSQIRSPHELHLRDMKVKVKQGHPTKAVKAMGLDERRLQYLLWDRVLHWELSASGKQHLVNKTPNDVYIVDQIAECWPDAKFIFLLRHPLAIARSRANAVKRSTPERNLEVVLNYATALEDARQKLDGLTVRYEDLTRNPARISQEVCTFIGVDWEESMLNYGEHDHGPVRVGLGDWKDKIKTGEIQPAPPPPPPEEIPPQLRSLSIAWGYLTPDGRTAEQRSVEVS